MTFFKRFFIYLFKVFDLKIFPNIIYRSFLYIIVQITKTIFKCPSQVICIINYLENESNEGSTKKVSLEKDINILKSKKQKCKGKSNFKKKYKNKKASIKKGHKSNKKVISWPKIHNQQKKSRLPTILIPQPHPRPAAQTNPLPFSNIIPLKPPPPLTHLPQQPALPNLMSHLLPPLQPNPEPSPNNLHQQSQNVFEMSR
jgi:hypothetical protein